jgi:acyl carrier protein
MNHAAIYEALTGIFREVFDDDTINIAPSTTARDIRGWDSQAMINLVVATEQRFAIVFRTAEIEQLDSVGNFVDLITAKCRRMA